MEQLPIFSSASITLPPESLIELNSSQYDPLPEEQLQMNGILSSTPRQSPTTLLSSQNETVQSIIFQSLDNNDMLLGQLSQGNSRQNTIYLSEAQIHHAIGKFKLTVSTLIYFRPWNSKYHSIPKYFLLK
jgi:hypothetical protein